MQPLSDPLYDPQAILKILQSSEKAKPSSFFSLLKAFVLLPSLACFKKLGGGWCMKAMEPLKTANELADELVGKS